MLFADEHPVQGDELIFSYRPGVNLKHVMSSFEEFYAEYNPLGQESLSRIYDSGRAGLLYSMSGGGTFDMVVLYFSDYGENSCSVKFFAKGTSKGSTKNSYDQVRIFFEKWAAKLLQLERWGEYPGTPIEEGVRHICRNCGRVIPEREATYCWHCGAAQPPKEGEASPLADNSQKEGQASSRRQVRSCLVCGLRFDDGDLLAWCPFCGAAAHRIHLLEFLHVKNSCPACGHHLDEQNLSAQLGRAHLRLPEKPHA
jgi:predicted RNA-binding Zn-ribbon protein involved in translation (DUF1610 family)